MTFEEYILPELVVLVPVLYIVGMALKRSSVSDTRIPIILGAFGMFLACLYEFSTMGISMDSLFIGIVQGLLCAGCAVYGNQIVKQSNKDE